MPRLRPREDEFYTLFAQAGANIADAAGVLAELTVPGADRRSVAARMREFEHRGDSITHSILRLLNKSFVTPFDREDIYRLAGSLDDVVDALDEATDFVELAHVGDLPDAVLEQIRLIGLGARATAEATGRLRTLDELEPYWIQVNELENEADRVYRDLLSRLFSGEFEIMRLLKLREVADLLERGADALEHVAHAVETIAVKES